MFCAYRGMHASVQYSMYCVNVLCIISISAAASLQLFPFYCVLPLECYQTKLLKKANLLQQFLNISLCRLWKQISSWRTKKASLDLNIYCIFISSALSRAFLPEHFFIIILFIVHPIQPWSALYSSSLQIHLHI